jgi:hypothetical protein
MKTNKHQTLLLIQHARAVRAKHIVEAFDYTPGTARSYLANLGRQDLLHRTEGGYTLSPKGVDRLQFFEVGGCGDYGCPRCRGKEGSYSCPVCRRRVRRDSVRLKRSWQTLFFHKTSRRVLPGVPKPDLC